MSLSIIECRNCGTSFWTAAVGQGEQISGAIAAGPCCKGIPVLDIEHYPTERSASKAYPAWAAADQAAMYRKMVQAGNTELRYAA